MDATHALIYTCAQLLDDGTCNSSKVFVNVLSRSTIVSHIEPIAMNSLSAAAQAACLEIGDLEPNIQAGTSYQKTITNNLC
jgi:hypothetical protein